MSTGRIFKADNAFFFITNHLALCSFFQVHVQVHCFKLAFGFIVSSRSHTTKIKSVKLALVSTRKPSPYIFNVAYFPRNTLLPEISQRSVRFCWACCSETIIIKKNVPSFTQTCYHTHQ